MPGVVLATGHYRNGILLAPITAELVRAIVLGKKTPIDLTPFEAARLKPGRKSRGGGRGGPRAVAPRGK
jgi:glycine oxidase